VEKKRRNENTKREKSRERVKMARDVEKKKRGE